MPASLGQLTHPCHGVTYKFWDGSERAFEALAEPVSAQILDSDRTVEPGVARLVHFAHPRLTSDYLSYQWENYFGDGDGSAVDSDVIVGRV